MVVAAQPVKRVVSLIAGQANLLTDFTSLVLAGFAGSGGGKTLLLYFFLQDRLIRYPGNTWLVAEPSYPMLTRVIVTSSDPARPNLIDYLRMTGFQPNHRAVDRIIETNHGTQTHPKAGQIYLASADNPDSLQGAAVKGVCLDEAGLMSLQAYEVARQRVGMMQGQVLLTTTPYNMGWLKTEISDKAGTNGIHVERWRSIDRPGFPLETYEAMKKVLPPWRFAMLYDAMFQHPEGLIYESFDEAICLKERFPIPKEWPVYVGHDFGASNPAAMFYAVQPTVGDIWAFHEYLPGPGKSAPDHVKAWQEITRDMNVVGRVGGNHQEEETRQLYRMHGWPITESKVTGSGSVENQILKVIGLHRLNKIKVFRDLRHYLDEKRGFSRVLGPDSKPTDKIDDESRYHLSSCERYVLSDFTPETAEKATSEAFIPFQTQQEGFQNWRERRSLLASPSDLVPFR